jgi:hypothetical protein
MTSPLSRSMFEPCGHGGRTAVIFDPPSGKRPSMLNAEPHASRELTRTCLRSSPGRWRLAAMSSRPVVPVVDGIRWRSDPTTSRCRMPAVAARHPAAGIHLPSDPTTGPPRMARVVARRPAVGTRRPSGPTTGQRRMAERAAPQAVDTRWLSHPTNRRSRIAPSSLPASRPSRRPSTPTPPR